MSIESLSPQAQKLVQYIVENQKIKGQEIRLRLLISQSEYVKAINEAIDAGLVERTADSKYYRVIPKI